MDKKICEKCQSTNAVVWFASVSGKGKTTKHRYCRKCANEERIRLLSNIVEHSISPQPNTSVLDMVKKAISNPESSEQTATMSSEQKIKSLNKSMQMAIKKEDYENAAKIRDEIAAIQKSETKK